MINDLRVEVCLSAVNCAKGSSVWISHAVSGIPISVSNGHSFVTDLNGVINVIGSDSIVNFNGAFQGVFTSNDAGEFGFAAGFRWIQDVGSFGSLIGTIPNVLDGALLFQATTDTSQSGLSAADLSSVNRVSVFTRNNNRIQKGLASEFSLENAIYVDGVSASSLPLTFSADFDYFELSSVTPNTLETTVGGFDLQWGLWSDPSGQLVNATRFRNGLGDRVFENINDSAVLISANITDVSSLTGEKQFDSISNHLIDISGFENNSLGPISGFFTVDFGTGEVTGGRVDFCIGADSCNVGGFGKDF